MTVLTMVLCKVCYATNLLRGYIQLFSLPAIATLLLLSSTLQYTARCRTAAVHATQPCLSFNAAIATAVSTPHYTTLKLLHSVPQRLRITVALVLLAVLSALHILLASAAPLTLTLRST
jgi:hypothetical protein